MGGECDLIAAVEPKFGHGPSQHLFSYHIILHGFGRHYQAVLLLCGHTTWHRFCLLHSWWGCSSDSVLGRHAPKEPCWESSLFQTVVHIFLTCVLWDVFANLTDWQGYLDSNTPSGLYIWMLERLAKVFAGTVGIVHKVAARGLSDLTLLEVQHNLVLQFCTKHLPKWQM